MNTENVLINYALIPLLIFLLRIADVSMGTLRIIFISRGIRFLAAFLGFFEVLIWLVAIGQIMQNLHNPVHYIAYAAGFGMGNFVGISLERRLSMGNRTVRVITKKDATELVRALRKENYGVTSLDGEGTEGPVKLIFTVVKRNRVGDVIDIIKKHNPNAFYTVEDIRYVLDRNVYPIEKEPASMFRGLLSLAYKKK